MADLNMDSSVTGSEDNSQNSEDSELYQVLEDVLNIYVPLFISLCGVVGNLFNIFIFLKLGIKDSMGVGLFALSFTDLLTTLLYAVVCLCYLTDKLYPDSPINAWAIGYFAFGWMMNAMYLTSCWITAVITIERCVCVASPFKVKQIFTRFRSTVAILVIYIIHIGLHIPIYVIHRMEWVEFPVESTLDNNMTELTVRVFTTLFVEETARVEMIFDVTVSLALSYLSFTITIVCTVWMIHSLETSSKIRLVESSEISKTDSDRSKLSYRERKLVKVVMTLAITLSSFGVPRVVVVTVYNSMPDINTGPLQRYIIIMWAVAYICTTLGCSITIFVYLALNSSYRVIFYRCIRYHR